jgi:hypothetical protein
MGNAIRCPVRRGKSTVGNTTTGRPAPFTADAGEIAVAGLNTTGGTAVDGM